MGRRGVLVRRRHDNTADETILQNVQACLFDCFMQARILRLQFVVREFSSVACRSFGPPSAGQCNYRRHPQDVSECKAEHRATTLNVWAAWRHTPPTTIA